MFRNWKMLVAMILIAMLMMSSANVFAETIDEAESEQVTVEAVTKEPAAEKTVAPASAKVEATPTPVKAGTVSDEKDTTPAEKPDTAEQDPIGKAPDATKQPTAEEQPSAQQQSPAMEPPTVEVEPATEESLQDDEKPAVKETADPGKSDDDEDPDVGEMKKDRSVSIEITNGKPSGFQKGDTVILQAVLQGYEGVDYEVTWEYSLDCVTWETAPEVFNQLKYTFTMDEETATWYWRVLIDSLENIDDHEVPLSDGLHQGNDDIFIVIGAGLGILLLGGCVAWIVIRRKSAQA